MKYIFFDIECASARLESGSAIYSFGYVKTDEDFNILETDDIIINPDCRFEPYVKSKILAYDMAVFSRAPKFNIVYEKIKALLTEKDTLVLGHAVKQNDARFVLSECTRYGLKPFDFTFYDTQVLFAAFLGETKFAGLDKMAETLGVEKPQGKHRSDEDSIATMLSMKEVCRRKETSLFNFICKTKYCSGKVEAGALKTDDQPKAELYFKDIVLKNNNLQGKNLTLYYKFLSSAKSTPGIEKRFLGKTFYLDYSFTDTKFLETVKLTQLIIDFGGKITSYYNEADYIIYDRKEGRKLVFRGSKVAQSTILNVLEVSELFKTTWIQILKMPLPTVNLNKKSGEKHLIK